MRKWHRSTPLTGTKSTIGIKQHPACDTCDRLHTGRVIFCKIGDSLYEVEQFLELVQTHFSLTAHDTLHGHPNCRFYQD